MLDNVHAVWCINFAHRLSERICAFQGVQAIIIAGSVARGFVLPYSQAIDETKKLLDDTLALAALHMPSIDTNQIRRQMEYICTAHSRAVRY